MFRWFDNNHCHHAKLQYQDIAVKDLKYNPTLSYTCTDAKHLQTMLAKLEELMKVFKSGLPSSEGLTLQILSLLKRTWQIKQKYRNLSSTYSSLESPLTLQTWTKESSFQIQKQSREKGTMLSLICLSCYYNCTLHSQYMHCILYRKQNRRNTAQTNLLPGAFICTHLMFLWYVPYS